ELARELTDAYEGFWTPRVTRAFEEFVDDLSNWYVRRNRSRFWDGEEAALRTLWYALAQALRLVAPAMPFLTEHLWQNLVAGPCREAPESVHLAGWPEPSAGLADSGLVEEVAAARSVVELGHSARNQAGHKLRQPLRRLLVATADAGRRALVSRQVEEIAGELRVKEVEITERPHEVAELRAMARLDLVGPRYGPNLPELRRLLDEGSFEVTDGNLRAGPYVLAAGEFSLEYRPKEGWAVSQDDGFVVAVDTRLDEVLELEGRVLDVIHAVQRMRKEAGLEITDRIVLTLPEAGAELLAHEERIRSETLAVRIELGAELALERA
ncbi:MAG: class I tRNA ligase family protein, partial [Gaiellaceae bacterium]